jgi:hypothetical protein
MNMILNEDDFFIKMDNDWNEELNMAALQQEKDCSMLAERFYDLSRRYFYADVLTQIITTGLLITLTVAVLFPVDTIKDLIIGMGVVAAVVSFSQIIVGWNRKFNAYERAYLDISELADNINQELAKKVEHRTDAYEFLANINTRKRKILRTVGIIPKIYKEYNHNDANEVEKGLVAIDLRCIRIQNVNEM